jgi:N-carbamoyl-L-amino-acid hydrolase
MTLRVDAARLRRDLTALGSIGRQASGGISRTSYSAEDAQARAWYRERCQEAGLTLRTDGLGNMFARPQAYDAAAAAIWTGSHIDTVPDGGPLDGALGSVAALECVRRIAESGIELRRPVQAVVFADEEGNYGHLLGSRGVVDGFSADELAVMTGRDGDRLIDALSGCGWVSGSATATRIAAGEVHAFVELHIEQGPKLEAASTDIGVVTSIVGLGGGIVEFLGRADHAGTTPMTARQDALLAAGAFLTELPPLAASISADAVITCGIIRSQPGGANVVPALAELTLDFRDPDHARLNALAEGIGQVAAAVAVRHDVTARWHPTARIAPVPLDTGIRDVVRKAAADLGLSHFDLPSGAGHDSQNLARLAPTGMIFVPSMGGRSHSPAEHTGWADIENGANVLLATLLELAAT